MDDARPRFPGRPLNANARFLFTCNAVSNRYIKSSRNVRAERVYLQQRRVALSELRVRVERPKVTVFDAEVRVQKAAEPNTT